MDDFSIAILDRANRLTESLNLFERLAPPANKLDPVRNSWVSIYPPFSEGQANPDVMYRDWISHTREEVTFLYFHLPFCQRRCDFCYFDVSTDIDSAGAYIERLWAEAEPFLEHINDGARVGHLYFGGGTPSIVNTEILNRLVARVRQRLTRSSISRATIEVHPRHIRKDFDTILHSGAVNRISIGVQSTNQNLLSSVGRSSATAKEVVSLCERFRGAGVAEINLDFMVGLHGQTVIDALADITLIDYLIKEELIDSVTVYPRSFIGESRILPYEVISPKTLLERMRMQLCYMEYFRVLERWREYPTYFFSRLSSLPMRPSSTTLGPVAKIGFGNSAYSHFDNCNYRNKFVVPRYLASIERYGCATENRHILNKAEAFRRRLIFGAKSGIISLGSDIPLGSLSGLNSWISQQESLGLMVRESDCARLTVLGKLFVETIIHQLDNVCFAEDYA